MLPQKEGHLAVRIVTDSTADIRLQFAHASLLLQQGVHPKIVSERLVHSSVNITLDTHSHVLPGLQAEAAARLDGLLAKC